MKSFAALSLLAAAAVAQKCDLICPMNYSIDLDACACVEKKYMECHPDYGNDCV